MNTSVVGRRIGGFIVDLIVAWLIVVIAAVAVMESIEVPPGNVVGQEACDVIQDEYPMCFYANDTYLVGTDGDVGLLILVAIGAWFVTRIIPQGISGRTLGKLIFGTRVVNAEGKAPGFWRSLLREILWIIDSLPFLYLVGLITAAVTKQHQRVGDMAAGTFVTRADDVSALGSYSNAAPPTAQQTPAQPVWDPVRNAYIHTDSTGRTQIYDQSTGQWRDA